MNFINKNFFELFICFFLLIALSFHFNPIKIGYLIFFIIFFLIIPGFFFQKFFNLLSDNFNTLFNNICLSLIFGVIIYSFLLLILVRLNLVNFQFFIPLFFIFLIIKQKIQLNNFNKDRNVFIDLIFILITLYISSWWVWGGEFVGLDNHLDRQAASARVLDNGYPLKNYLLDGMKYSNNYLAHVFILGISKIINIELGYLTRFTIPIFYLGLAIVSVYFFCKNLLGLNRILSFLVLCSIFMIVGFSDINVRWFGRAVPTATTLVLSPLFAFTLFFANLIWINYLSKLNYKKSFLILSINLLLGFLMAGARGPGAIILLSSLLFLIFIKIIQRKKIIDLTINFLFTFFGIFLGLLFFLNFLGEYSGTSFVQFNFFKLEWFELNRLKITKFLINNNLIENIYYRSLFSYAWIVFFLGGFLSLYFWFGFLPKIIHINTLEILILGASLAGVLLVGITNAKGGSQFTFYHYSIIGVSVLCAIGLKNILIQNQSVFIKLIHIVSILLLVIHFFDIYKGKEKLKLSYIYNHNSINPKIKDADQIDNLFKNIQKNERILIDFFQAPTFATYVFYTTGIPYIEVHKSFAKRYLSWGIPNKGKIKLRTSLLAQLKTKFITEGILDENLLDQIYELIIFQNKKITIITKQKPINDLKKLKLIQSTDKFYLYEFRL